MKELPQQMKNWLWEADVYEMSWFRRSYWLAMRVVYTLVRDLKEGQLSLRAMSLVYTTVLSLVPLLALSFSVLKGFGAHDEIRPALESMLEPMGDQRGEIVDKIVGFVDNIEVKVLGAVGLGFLIYTVISMMQKIERSFNYAWHIESSRSFGKRFSDYLSVLLLGPVLIFFSAGLTTSLRASEIMEHFSALPGAGMLFEMLGVIVPYLIMSFAFAFIYYYMPNAKVKIGPAFVGGLVTSVAWKTMGWFFVTFVASSTTQTAIYSVFASVIIFMVWLYIGWLVLLLGSSVAFYVQYPNNMQIAKRRVRLSNSTRERLGLLVMLLISEKYDAGEKAWTADTLARRANLSMLALNKMLAVFVDAGLLLKTEGDHPEYVPAKPLEKVRVLDVVSVVRESGDNARQGRRLKSQAKVEAFFEDAQGSMDERLGKMTLKDMVDSE